MPAFEKSARGLIGEDERRALEILLLENPGRGPVIRGTGGVRKLRIGLRGRGKRGGGRVIYYFRAAKDRIYMITAYGKTDQTELSAGDRAVIRELVERLEGEE